MKFIKSTFGYFLAAIIINACWGLFTNKFGILGGYLAAFFLTGSMWYINHYLCLIKHEDDSAFVDMGLGIAICLLTKGYILNGVNSIMSSIPTLICIVIGAVAGGYVAVVIEKSMMEKRIIKENNKLEVLNE